MQIGCSTCSFILNSIAIQYTCSLKDIYYPSWLVQWSHHCSRMCVPFHSPWLPGYIGVVLVILTMAGLLPDRLCISMSLVFCLFVSIFYLLFFVLYSTNEWNHVLFSRFLMLALLHLLLVFWSMSSRNIFSTAWILFFLFWEWFSDTLIPKI